MGRTVITWKDMKKYNATHPSKGYALTGGAKVDDYPNRILKYIPTEVVTVYLLLEGLLKSGVSQAHLTIGLWILFSFGCAVTPLYLWRMQKVTKPSQLLISTGAFAVWVMGIGGPFQEIPRYLSSMILVAYVFLIPLIGGFPDQSYSSNMPE